MKHKWAQMSQGEMDCQKILTTLKNWSNILQSNQKEKDPGYFRGKFYQIFKWQIILISHSLPESINGGTPLTHFISIGWLWHNI